MHKWGFKQKVPRRVHVNTASKEEKERFKKEQERYYWIISTSSSSIGRNGLDPFEMRTPCNGDFFTPIITGIGGHTDAGC